MLSKISAINELLVAAGVPNYLLFCFFVLFIGFLVGWTCSYYVHDLHLTRGCDDNTPDLDESEIEQERRTR